MQAYFILHLVLFIKTEVPPSKRQYTLKNVVSYSQFLKQCSERGSRVSIYLKLEDLQQFAAYAQSLSLNYLSTERDY